MIMAALAVASMVSGVKSGMDAKAAAKESYEQQSALAAEEYEFNTENLTDTFFDNLNTNFSNTASSLFDLTDEYITKNSSINMMSTKFTGTGISYSSASEDSENSLKSEYLTKMVETSDARDYQEQIFEEDYKTNMYQAGLNKNKTSLGLSTALATSERLANQQMLNSAINGATTLYGLKGE